MKEVKEEKVIKKSDSKVVSVLESEDLQRNGYKVVAMYIKDGVMMHELVKEG